MIFRKLSMMKPFLPAILVAAVVGGTLYGYQVPAYTAKASSNKAAEESSSKSKSELPAVKTLKKENPATKKAEPVLEEADDASEYKDGTYTGSAQGFGGTIKVQVTIKNGKIKNIIVLEASGEDEPYFTHAKGLIQVILDKQSTDVDVVSGATYSSTGLINAIRNALVKAAVTSGSSDRNDDSEENSSSTGQAAEVSGKVPYIDGIYYGTGDGFSGMITVGIVIENHTIKSAVVTQSVDDEPFLTRAKTILTKVVSKQNADVDVVSGATYSSNGIIDAVKNALKAAKEATDKANGKNTSTDSSSGTSSGSGGTENSGGTTDTNTTDMGSSGSGTTDTGSTDSGSGTAVDSLYTDGVYKITAVCYPDQYLQFNQYNLTMNVTIKNDWVTAVTSIAEVGGKNNLTYINRAINGTTKIKGIPAQIVAKGAPTDIDTVSGATCTSDAIIEGVKTALATAAK